MHAVVCVCGGGRAQSTGDRASLRAIALPACILERLSRTGAILSGKTDPSRVSLWHWDAEQPGRVGVEQYPSPHQC